MTIPRDKLALALLVAIVVVVVAFVFVVYPQIATPRMGGNPG